jgi:hypothetical protein
VSSSDSSFPNCPLVPTGWLCSAGALSRSAAFRYRSGFFVPAAQRRSLGLDTTVPIRCVQTRKLNCSGLRTIQITAARIRAEERAAQFLLAAKPVAHVGSTTSRVELRRGAPSRLSTMIRVRWASRRTQHAEGRRHTANAFYDLRIHIGRTASLVAAPLGPHPGLFRLGAEVTDGRPTEDLRDAVLSDLALKIVLARCAETLLPEGQLQAGLRRRVADVSAAVGFRETPDTLSEIVQTEVIHTDGSVGQTEHVLAIGVCPAGIAIILETTNGLRGVFAVSVFRALDAGAFVFDAVRLLIGAVVAAGAAEVFSTAAVAA